MTFAVPVAPAFQSTLSVRRATIITDQPHRFPQISIHALRKESDQEITVDDANDKISIHALRKESDTLSDLLAGCLVISIHALRKESD